MRLLQLIIVAFVAGGVMVSCSSDGCTNTRNAIPMAGFYDLKTGASAAIIGMKVYGVGSPGDSLLVDTARSSHQIYLPLRGTLSSTSFVFDAETVTDTLTINYESYPYFDGEDCGAMWRYVITSVGYNRTIIDSVLVTDPDINNIERERLMIFVTVPSDPEPEPSEPEPEPEV